MERSTSTVDKNSLKSAFTPEFTKMTPLPIQDLKVFIFMKPNAEVTDPYMTHVISYLQKYNISCYVTEEAKARLKEELESKSTGKAETSILAEHPSYDMDKLTIFTDSNQKEVNLIIECRCV